MAPGRARPPAGRLPGRGTGPRPIESAGRGHLCPMRQGDSPGPQRITTRYRSRKENAMPNVTVEGPSLSLDKKRELSVEITDTAARVYGLPMEAIVVVIKENPPENVCVGGRMICDNRAILKED